MSIKKNFFAPSATGLGGAVRRAAMLLLVMMLTTMTAWATTTSTINVGGTDYTLFTGFTATAGTEVDNTFVYGNMVDGDLSSSFHVFTSPAYVEFNTDEPIIPKGYIFNTYNASSYKPTSWVLKAKANTADEWTTLSSNSGSLASGQEFQYACDNSGNNAYKYFRFEVSNNNDNIWLTEIRLYGNMSYTHIAVKAATCTETGIKQECWRRTDGKYFTDETGTTELAESDVIAPMIPHNGQHHDATDTNIEYWQCSVCHKYFSDSDCTTEITEAETQTTVFGALSGGCYTLTSQTYTLTADVNTDGYIYVPTGVTATIDLAGHTIDCGLTSAVANGYVIKVAGTLTLTDSGTGGTVKGGMHDEYTSCVYVPDGGTFTLAGGTLIGNTSNEDNRAVYVAYPSAHFIMTGGKITGDVCGIVAGGYLTISGGEISGNSQGGIYPRNYSMSISGNPIITDNGNVNIDLYYNDAARLTVVGTLTEGASIGITPNGTPTADTPVTVTSGYSTYNTASPGTYFTLDDNSLVLGWNEDRTEVAVGTALYTVDFDMNGHGSAIDAVSLLSGYKVLEPTVPTADDWYFVGWYTNAACTAGNEYDFDDAVTSNMTLHALWTQTAIHSITLPEKMVIVSADQETVGGKYPVGTVIKFKVSSADYVVDGDVKNGEEVMTADGEGIYTVTMGDADITITATIKKAVEPNKTLSGSESYTANDGDVLTGSTSGTVTIPDGAKITLSDVTISGGIVCNGTADITLVGTNSVTGASQKAGIQVGGSGTTLTIKGNGSLSATGGQGGAGIGTSVVFSNGSNTSGNITIMGGSITATGAEFDPNNHNGGNGIGTGYTYANATNTIGTITITTGIDRVEASSISGTLVYKNETETDVTATASTYFTIIEDGDRRVITQKDDTDYTITIADNLDHGTIAYAATTAKYGEKITITATPDFGYRLSRLVVKDTQNNSVASTGNSFFMPKSNVTVSAVFEQGVHGTTEFAWSHYDGQGLVTDATIYDGVTTVNLQQERSYSIIKYSGYSYSKFLLDNDTYNVNIPYAGGTGAFVQNRTSFNNNGDAGFYDITMTDVGNGKWSVSILKTVGQMDVVPDQTYTGSEIKPEPLVMAGSLNLTKGTDYEYSYTNNTNVGTAKVIVTFQGTYASLGSVEKEFNIVKATPAVNAPTAVENLIHNGSAQTLVNAGSTDFGTLLYSLDGQNYSADIPTGTDAGTYTIYYKVEGSDNWNAVAAQTIQATILPSTVIVNVTGNGTVTYNDKSAASGETFGVAAEKGTDVTLTLAPESGYAVSIAYGYTNNSGTTASGLKLPINGTTATLTVPNDLKDGTYVTMTVSFVSALAGGADEASAVALTDNTVTDLGGGWYKVDSDISFDHTLNLLGDTHLIIADGKTMTVNTASNRGIYSDYTLFVSGEGTLSVATTGDYGIAVCVGNYVQTGATVTASGYIGIRCTDDFIGFDFDNDFTFSGGQLTATGSGGGGIDADNDITLSCTNATDFIQASSYSSGYGAVKIADGQTLVDDGGNIWSGTLSNDDLQNSLLNKTLRPVMGVVLTKDGSGNISAEFDGTSLETMSIPVDITVNSVTLNRTFTYNKCATLMLPFSLGDGQSLKGGILYKFDGVNNGEGDWVATLSEFTSPLKANTPYLIQPNGHMTDDKITFDLNGGTVTLNTTTAGEDSNEKDDLWDFIGTYSYIKWTTVTGDQDYSAEREAEIGKVYGFAAVEKTGIRVGDFVRVASGAKIRPMCAYLKWKGSIPNNARALTRAATNDDTELPQRITVKLVSASGETTAIGTLDTTTGEVSFDSEAWYTLDGVRLSGQPSTKGIYINNGKKIVIK